MIAHRMFVACCELDVPYCTQIGHTGPLMSSELGRPIYLDRVALDFPELKIVAGHIGYPWTDEAIAVATKHEDVYIDTSAPTFLAACVIVLLFYGIVQFTAAEETATGVWLNLMHLAVAVPVGGGLATWLQDTRA